MPTYTAKCDKCDNEFDFISSVNNRNQYTDKPCEHDKCEGGKFYLKMHVTGFGDPVRMGFVKGDNGMKEVLQKIHEKTAGSQLDKHSTITKI